MNSDVWFALMLSALAEMRHGTTTVRDLSRKLGMEQSALDGVLRFMLRKKLIRRLHPECRPKGCRGCHYQGKCQDLPVSGYELVEEPE